MKLINDLYNVLETSVTDGGFSTTIRLNPKHIVYAGHFPGHPVTPGVIQLQIVHELLEHHLSVKLKLIEMPQCKFQKILNPDETSQLVIYIEIKQHNDLIVNARGGNGSDIFFKLNAVYRLFSHQSENIF